jgi:hypothetical protein
MSRVPSVEQSSTAQSSTRIGAIGALCTASTIISIVSRSL